MSASDIQLASVKRWLWARNTLGFAEKALLGAESKRADAMLELEKSVVGLTGIGRFECSRTTKIFSFHPRDHAFIKRNTCVVFSRGSDEPDVVFPE